MATGEDVVVDGMVTGDDVVVTAVVVTGDDVVGTILVEVVPAALTEVPVAGLLLVVAALGGTAAVLETAGATEPDPAAVDAGAPPSPPGGLSAPPHAPASSTSTDKRNVKLIPRFTGTLPFSMGTLFPCLARRFGF